MTLTTGQLSPLHPCVPKLLSVWSQHNIRQQEQDVQGRRFPLLHTSKTPLTALMSFVTSCSLSTRPTTSRHRKMRSFIFQLIWTLNVGNLYCGGMMLVRLQQLALSSEPCVCVNRSNSHLHKSNTLVEVLFLVSSCCM